MFKHVTDTVSYIDVVNEICEHYVEFLKRIENDGYHPVVWGPIASQKDEWRSVAETPAVGSESDRNKAVIYFNEYMRAACDFHGWGFLSIYRSLIDENYMTREKFIYDKCHLGNNAKPLFEEEFSKWKESIKQAKKKL